MQKLKIINNKLIRIKHKIKTILNLPGTIINHQDVILHKLIKIHKFMIL